MQIHGPGHVHRPQPINPPQQPSVQPTNTAPSSPAIQAADEVSISEAAQAASRTPDSAPVRLARVAAIRAQIANGTYETAEKLDTAVERLLDEIG